MDIVELLPFIIMGLVYLFGSSAKKKAEEAKKKAQTQMPVSNTKPKQGLQERLEDALRQMQARVEGERSQTATPVRSETTATLDADQVANEIDRLTSSTLYDREVYTSSEAQKPTSTAQGEQFEFHSLMKEIPNETYHGHGFSKFKQAHGIHYGETDEPAYADDRYQTEFHEAHGIHYGESVDTDERGSTIKADAC